MDMKSIAETRFTLTNDPADADYRLITLRLPAAALPDHAGTIDVTGQQAMQETAKFVLSHAGGIMASIGHTVLGQDLKHMATVIHDRLP